ncbi:hypothetical protein ACIQMJ_30045 [Actinosynnema sp. NPDC091369]
MARLLLTVLTSPDPDERVAAYTTTVSILGDENFTPGATYWTLLLSALADDEATTVPLLGEAIVGRHNAGLETVVLVRCVSRLYRETVNPTSPNLSRLPDDEEIATMAGDDKTLLIALKSVLGESHRAIIARGEAGAPAGLRDA